MFEKPVLAAIALVFAAGTADALTVTFSGVDGNGTTTLAFSGDAVALADAAFGFPAMNSDVWAEVGDFVRVLNLAELAATSSTASVAVNGGATSSITGIHLDDDTPSSDDEFGIRIDSGPLSFSTGDVVSWTGALEIAVDFSLFNLGTYTSSALPFGSGRTLPMTLIVENAAPVPLPAGILLMLGGLGAVGTLGLRKSRADRSLT